MMFEVILSERADTDLREIYEYIAFTLLSPENAESQLERLENSILKLNQMPERFRLYVKEPWYSNGNFLDDKSELGRYLDGTFTRMVFVGRK